MILSVDHASEVPIYQQIRAELIAAIASGELSAGDRLPSVRALASDLGVNLHTVNKAYAMLRDEGYVLMRGRSGAHVADVPRHASPELLARTTRNLTIALRDLAFEFRARGGSLDDFLALAVSQAQHAYGESAGHMPAEAAAFAADELTPAAIPAASSCPFSAITGKDLR